MKDKVIFPIRHNERVRLIVDLPEIPLQKGRCGKVIAMVENGGQAHYLVKWDRKSWPVDVLLTQIEKEVFVWNSK